MHFSSLPEHVFLSYLFHGNSFFVGIESGSPRLVTIDARQRMLLTLMLHACPCSAWDEQVSVRLCQFPARLTCITMEADQLHPLPGDGPVATADERRNIAGLDNVMNVLEMSHSEPLQKSRHTWQRLSIRWSRQCHVSNELQVKSG